MHRFIYVARHGETDWNTMGRYQGHTDVPLNDRGRDQARALAHALRGERIATVVTSDLARARETAEIVGRELAVPVGRIDGRLRERRYGVFEGRTRDEIAREHPEAWRAWNEDARAHPPGGEPHEAFAARLKNALVDIAEALATPKNPVLVLSHGGAMRCLLLVTTGMRISPPGNASVYRLAYRAEQFDYAQLVWAGT